MLKYTTTKYYSGAPCVPCGQEVTCLKSYNVSTEPLVPHTKINQRQMGAKGCAFSFIWNHET